MVIFDHCASKKFGIIFFGLNYPDATFWLRNGCSCKSVFSPQLQDTVVEGYRYEILNLLKMTLIFRSCFLAFYVKKPILFTQNGSFQRFTHPSVLHVYSSTVRLLEFCRSYIHRTFRIWVDILYIFVNLLSIQNIHICYCPNLPFSQFCYFWTMQWFSIEKLWK